MQFGLVPTSFNEGPGVSSVVFFSGCNLRCPYCYNSSVVNGNFVGHTENEIVHFIRSIPEVNSKGKAFNKVDYVIFSGGECTASLSILERLIQEVKLIPNLKVGVYTNGTALNSTLFQKLIETVDYMSIDLKGICISDSFPTIEVGSSEVAKVYPTKEMRLQLYDNIEAAISAADKGQLKLDIRTTVVKGIVGPSEIKQMFTFLLCAGRNFKWYLQGYNDMNGTADLMDREWCSEERRVPLSEVESWLKDIKISKEHPIWKTLDLSQYN